MPEITKTDLSTAVKYLEDALKLYDALAALPMQRAVSRAHMIRQLIAKLKPKINASTPDYHKLLNIPNHSKQTSSPHSQGRQA